MIIGFLLFLTAACSTTQGGSENSKPDKKNAPLYYDFGDVLIPHDLKVDTDTSFVYRSGGFTAGVLALSGRVKTDSLIKFFENNMANDNWLLVSSFKSSRTMLMFQKENRWCVINITDGKFKTPVEIWVAPLENALEGGLLKKDP